MTQYEELWHDFEEATQKELLRVEEMISDQLKDPDTGIPIKEGIAKIQFVCDTAQCHSAKCRQKKICTDYSFPIFILTRPGKLLACLSSMPDAIPCADCHPSLLVEKKYKLDNVRTFICPPKSTQPQDNKINLYLLTYDANLLEVIWNCELKKFEATRTIATDIIQEHIHFFFSAEHGYDICQLWLAGKNREIRRFSLLKNKEMPSLEFDIPVFDIRLYQIANGNTSNEIIAWGGNQIFLYRFSTIDASFYKISSIPMMGNIFTINIKDVCETDEPEIVVVYTEGIIQICSLDLIPLQTLYLNDQISAFKICSHPKRLMMVATASAWYITYVPISSTLRQSRKLLFKTPFTAIQYCQDKNCLLMGKTDGSFELMTMINSGNAIKNNISTAFKKLVEKEEENININKLEVIAKAFHRNPASIISLLSRWAGLVNLLIDQDEDLPESTLNFFSEAIQPAAFARTCNDKMLRNRINLQCVLKENLRYLSNQARSKLINSVQLKRWEYYPVDYDLIQTFSSHFDETEPLPPFLSDWKDCYDLISETRSNYNDPEITENMRRLDGLVITPPKKLEGVVQHVHTIEDGTIFTLNFKNDAFLHKLNFSRHDQSPIHSIRQHWFKKHCNIIFISALGPKSEFGTLSMVTSAGELILLEKVTDQLTPFRTTCLTEENQIIDWAYAFQRENMLFISSLIRQNAQSYMQFHILSRNMMSPGEKQRLEPFLGKKWEFNYGCPTICIPPTDGISPFFVGTQRDELIMINFSFRGECSIKKVGNLPPNISSVIPFVGEKEDGFLIHNRHKLYKVLRRDPNTLKELNLQGIPGLIRIAELPAGLILNKEELAWIVLGHQILGYQPETEKVIARRPFAQIINFAGARFPDPDAPYGEHLPIIIREPKSKQNIGFGVRYIAPEPSIIEENTGDTEISFEGKFQKPRPGKILSFSLSFWIQTDKEKNLISGWLDKLFTLNGKIKIITNEEELKRQRNDNRVILVFLKSDDEILLNRIKEIAKHEQVIIFHPWDAKKLSGDIHDFHVSCLQLRRKIHLKAWLKKYNINSFCHISDSALDQLWDLTLHGSMPYVIQLSRALENKSSIMLAQVRAVLAHINPFIGPLSDMDNFLKERMIKAIPLIYAIAYFKNASISTEKKDSLATSLQLTEDDFNVLENRLKLVKITQHDIRIAPIWHYWLKRQPAPLKKIGLRLQKTMMNNGLSLKTLLDMDHAFFSIVPKALKENSLFYQTEWQDTQNFIRRFLDLQQFPAGFSILKKREKLLNFAMILARILGMEPPTNCEEQYETYDLAVIRFSIKSLDMPYVLKKPVIMLIDDDVSNKKISHYINTIINPNLIPAWMIDIRQKKKNIATLKHSGTALKNLIVLTEDDMKQFLTEVGRRHLREKILGHLSLKVQSGYETGGALAQGSRWFVGRENLLSDLFLSPKTHVIVGPRRIGKTSLLRRLELHLREAHRPVYYMDCSLIENKEQFFLKLSMLLFKQEKSISEITERLNHFRTPPVILIDEYDNIIQWELFAAKVEKSGEFGKESAISKTIRTWAQSDVARFVISGFWMVNFARHSQRHPFYNLLSSSILLGPLSKLAHGRLLEEPMGELGLSFEPAAMDLIKKASLRHPHLTQSIALSVLEIIDTEPISQEIIQEDHVKEVIRQEFYQQDILTMFLDAVRRPILKLFLLTHINHEQIELTKAKEWFKQNLPDQVSMKTFDRLWSELMLTGLIFPGSDKKRPDSFTFLSRPVRSVLKACVNVDEEIEKERQKTPLDEFEEIKLEKKD